MAVLVLLWIDASCMIKGAGFGTSVCSAADGVGGRPTVLGSENAATSAAPGTLECRNKDVNPLIVGICEEVVRFAASVGGY